jgi:hypothetical protein
MRGHLISIVAAAICLAAPFSVAGQKPVKSTSANVTTTIYDYSDASNTSQNLERSDDYNGANQASYSAADTGVSGGVVSTVGYSLDLSSQTTRKIFLSFSGWVSGAVQPVPDGLYNGTVFVRCFDSSGNLLNLFQLAATGSYNACSMHANFTSGGANYVFVMRPTTPGTGWSTVTCTAVNAAGCSAWHVVPNLDSTLAGNVPTVANLYRQGKNGSQTLVGSYHNTYRLDFSE